MSDGDVYELQVHGSGAESADLKQFKVYAVFFEEDADDAADVYIQVRDQNCGAGSTVLGWDFSFDTKKMVRLSGAAAAGEQLCVRLTAYHVPAGETRRVQVFTYYSEDTEMR